MDECRMPGGCDPDRRRLLLLPALLSVFGSLIFRSAAANGETIRITTGEWEPFLSEKFRNGGVILDIVVEAFRRREIEVDYQFLPWARAVKYVEDGKWDAMAVTGSRHSDSGAVHLYSDPVYIGTDVIFHRKSNPLEWQTFSDLHGLSFGTVLSYDYSDEFRQAVADGTVREVVAPEAHLLFPMLAAGRFDVFIMDKHAGMYTYNTQYRRKLGDAVTYAPRPLSTLDYSVRFSGQVSGNQRMLDLFNAGLREMREDGTFKHLYDKFEQGGYLVS